MTGYDRIDPSNIKAVSYGSNSAPSMTNFFENKSPIQGLRQVFTNAVSPSTSTNASADPIVKLTGETFNANINVSASTVRTDLAVTNTSSLSGALNTAGANIGNQIQRYDTLMDRAQTTLLDNVVKAAKLDEATKDMSANNVRQAFTIPNTSAEMMGLALDLVAPVPGVVSALTAANQFRQEIKTNMPEPVKNRLLAKAAEMSDSPQQSRSAFRALFDDKPEKNFSPDQGGMKFGALVPNQLMMIATGQGGVVRQALEDKKTEIDANQNNLEVSKKREGFVEGNKAQVAMETNNAPVLEKMATETAIVEAVLTADPVDDKTIAQILSNPEPQVKKDGMEAMTASENIESGIPYLSSFSGIKLNAQVATHDASAIYDLMQAEKNANMPKLEVKPPLELIQKMAPSMPSPGGMA